ncbi:MAG: restriction endonuclease subunit S [Coprothermobacterota bacterium]|nr:restriction endonuclease subunit S [Coprothermobacterota bacterium]
MLDTVTKHRIDTARDILVGKAPDPKSQVEQITIALIYKFMDDMDAESEEFGRKRSFFANDFARYGWAKLMRSGLGGHETLNLYAEAIAKMPENPGIPLLFRNIFKNAYLPYRDPETLKMFLKIIDEFAYDHSERLGDAFGLGAQRRPIEKNDLPQAQAEIGEYLRRLRAGESVADYQPTLGLIVGKEKIAANDVYNLSGERYREGTAHNPIFPLFRIGDICTIKPRKSQLANLSPDTRVSFVPMADLNEHRIAFRPTEEKRLSEVSASYTYFEDNDVLLAKVMPCFENGKAGIARGLLNGLGFGSSEFYVLRPTSQVLPEWIYHCATHPLFRDTAIAQMTGTGGLQRVPRSYAEDFQIPLPPLEVQKEIVAEIEGYQQQISNYELEITKCRDRIAKSVNKVWSADED